MAHPAIRELPDEGFVQWAIAQLGLQAQQAHGLVYLDVPEIHRERFDGRSELWLNLNGHDEKGLSGAAIAAQTSGDEEAAERPIESLDVDGPFLQWLCGELRAAGAAAHSRPADQPASVHEISGRLFPAYDLEGGTVHLSGCTLEDRPFLRLTYTDDVRLLHYFFAPDGSVLGDEQIQQLGLAKLTPVEEPHPKIDSAQLQLLIAAGVRYVESHEPFIATIIWAKYVTGRLQFTIDGASEVVVFQGWARTLEPPAFTCPHSGQQTFRLALTDDGRIVAAEAIARCEQSGRRVIDSELVQCSVTGKRVERKFIVTCPASGDPVLRDQMQQCHSCHQQVSRSVITAGSCLTCRSLVSVAKDDPRMVWLLAEYPGLDRLRKWELAESASVFVAQAATMWKRFLVVVDRETLSVLHLATRGRFSSQWIPLEGPQREELLK